MKILLTLIVLVRKKLNTVTMQHNSKGVLLSPRACCAAYVLRLLLVDYL